MFTWVQLEPSAALRAELHKVQSGQCLGEYMTLDDNSGGASKLRGEQQRRG